MSAKDRALIDPLHRLPLLGLPSVCDGELLPVRPAGRRNPLLVLVHGGSCDGCRPYINALRAQIESIRYWDGYPLIIATEPPAESGGTGMQDGLAWATDVEGALTAALRVQTPAVVIADQWGEVHVRDEGGASHRFMPVTEVVEWLRFLTIQCPECQAESF